MLVHCTLVHLCYDRVPRGGESEGPRSESEGSPCAGTLLPAYILHHGSVTFLCDIIDRFNN